MNIVWIHGYPHSSKIFAPQRAIPGYRHITPDLRGFGGTPAPDGPMTIGDYASDVLEVMDGLDRVVLAGLSMGGYIAMQILRDAPERVAALILLDTREVPDTAEGRAARMKTIDELRAGGKERVIDGLVPQQVITESLRPAARAIFREASPEGMIAALQAMADRPDSSETIRNATMPALIFVGDKDTVTPPSDSERMASMMRDAELAPIANAAHLANFERSDQVNHIIEAWLARKLSAFSIVSATR